MIYGELIVIPQKGSKNLVYCIGVMGKEMFS